jgi:hypothetical protein
MPEGGDEMKFSCSFNPPEIHQLLMLMMMMFSA